ncbi:MAG: hypothetical protein LBI28_08975 [Treponema sp.]|jgi:MFS family permease|nr:hypothetical protein [Treponema sp.]
MKVLFILLGIISGAAIAYLLNIIFSGKIENKNYRLALKVTSFIVCIILGITFIVIGSSHTILNIFIENRIVFIENKLNDVFPNQNILDTNIDTNELASAVNELQKTVNNIDTSRDSYFESLIFNVFLKKLAGYVNTIENGANTVIMMGDENGAVTIKSILYNLKDMALKTISPYFIFGQIAVIILLFIYIGIYAGVVVFLKKGGAIYNKSIVFGDIKYDNSKEKTNYKE